MASDLTKTVPDDNRLALSPSIEKVEVSHSEMSLEVPPDSATAWLATLSEEEYQHEQSKLVRKVHTFTSISARISF